MRRFSFLFQIFLPTFLLLLLFSCDQNKGRLQKVPASLQTQWGKQVDHQHPWPEYPRPQMVRKEWKNLNGLWDYTISPKQSKKPKHWNGKILVPYPVESALSGVKKQIGKDSLLWYFRKFTVPENWKKKKILLHFEAVDWETTVWVNDQPAGVHKGGYDPFTLDITDLLSNDTNQSLLVSVWDPTDAGTQPRGKQVQQPRGIWYTSTTGIWQTVWLEPVKETYLSSFGVITDPGNQSIDFFPNIINRKENDKIKLTATFKDKITGELYAGAGTSLHLPLSELHNWAPEEPVLYDLSIQLLRGEQVMDEVSGYFGMRTVTLEKDTSGIFRIFLNHKFLFQQGPLDQGFWPDGLYTPPTEEAMVYDLEMIQKMGFNMLRKHVKVEPRRYYYWCDKIGLLVWQDMPSGDNYIGPSDPDIERSESSAKQFKTELTRMIYTKFNHPSIIMWVPFNEGWGQFNTSAIVDLIKKSDPSRLVDNASGWTDRGVGDVFDVHHYPEPVLPKRQKDRALVLGEFGGLGLPVPGHTWVETNWGYRNMGDTLELLSRFEDFFSTVREYIPKGLSAAIYTQTTDVETETNGLMTYDRHPKLRPELISLATGGYAPPALQNENHIFTDTCHAMLTCSRPGADIHYTLDGSEPGKRSAKYTSAINLTATTSLKVKAFWPRGISSRTRTYKIEKVKPNPSLKARSLEPGLRVNLYKGTWETLPEFDSLTPVSSSVNQHINLSVTEETQNFGLVFDGYLRIPETGIYTFYLASDDGSRLIIDKNILIENDGIHGNRTLSASVALEQGPHAMRILYFQGKGGLYLRLGMTGPGIEEPAAISGMLWHK